MELSILLVDGLGIGAGKGRDTAPTAGIHQATFAPRRLSRDFSKILIRRLLLDNA
jgi:hypothetical protein